MATNDILLIQENASSDFVQRNVANSGVGSVLVIDASNLPTTRLLAISDITNLQTSLNAKIESSLIGVANGVAGLGADGKVPTAQLPDAVLGGMNYQGAWNASTNTPTIPVASSSNKGYYYVVTVAGSTSVGGITDWKVGDWIVSNGSAWEKVDNTDSVTSVAGKTGAVTLAIGDITSLQTSLDAKAPLASPTFTGTVTLPSTTSIGTVSNTEIGYLDGVTSAIQTQINGKANTSHTHLTADITDATNLNTANMIVKRDTSGNFSAGTITASLSGNATTATTLQTARNIKGVSFNGSANIEIEDRVGTPIASATTTTIGTSGLGEYIHITGTTTITSFGTASSAGIRRTLIFDGALTLTHNATSLICPGGANIVTVANTVIEVVAETTANWRVISITHPSLSMAEYSYLDGVTSAIQTQINGKANTSHTHAISDITSLQTSLDAKAPLASPTFTGTVTLPSTTSIGNVSSTELGYLDGVTSAIQTQLNAKLGFVSAPATTSSTGTAGQIAYDNDYLYICVATNTWKKTALAIW